MQIQAQEVTTSFVLARRREWTLVAVRDTHGELASAGWTFGNQRRCQRIAKQVGGGNREMYLLDGALDLGVVTVDGSGNLVSWYWNVLAGDKVVGRQPSVGDRLYYHTDLLGSTRSVVDASTQAVVESYDYDPWGVLMPGRTLGSGTKEGFTGKEQDAETGLHYFGARYAMSAVGRWAAVDAIGDDEPAWSTYSYVKDDPPTSVDPTGLSCRQLDPEHLRCTNFQAADWETIGEFLQGGDQRGGPRAGAGRDDHVRVAFGWPDSIVVIWDVTAATQEMRHGGSRSWRNNNPGNIRNRKLARDAGSIGVAGGFNPKYPNEPLFAIFPDVETGESALERLLRTPKYQGMTVFQAVKTYAPPGENNTAAYQASIQRQTGLSGDTRMSSLNAGDLRAVAAAIRRQEGWVTGTVTVIPLWPY